MRTWEKQFCRSKGGTYPEFHNEAHETKGIDPFSREVVRNEGHVVKLKDNRWKCDETLIFLRIKILGCVLVIHFLCFTIQFS